MNPFERFDIDPMQGPTAITERLRELTEEADEAQREELRAVWEELTLHPRRRLQIALQAFPETRVPVAFRGRGSQSDNAGTDEIAVRELIVVPRVAEVLTARATPPEVLPPIESDPFIDLPKE